jgi:hypothetical protein
MDSLLGDRQIARRWLWMAVAGLATTGAVACCAGFCVDGSHVEFQPPLGEPGEYRLEILGQGVDRACTFELPSPDEWPCDWVDTTRESGAVLSVDGFTIEGTLPRFDVRVSQDGEVISETNIRPRYEQSKVCQTECLLAESAIATGDTVSN